LFATEPRLLPETHNKRDAVPKAERRLECSNRPNVEIIPTTEASSLSHKKKHQHPLLTMKMDEFQLNISS
jgi:hypothetical protein